MGQKEVPHEKSFHAVAAVYICEPLFPRATISSRFEQTREARNLQPGSLPSRKAGFRPRIALQDALKIAEAYIGKEHIDIRPYWLYRALFVIQSDEKTPYEKRIPGWHFWWVNENGAAGDYVEIFVDMNGNALRMPSL
ncbi:MAG TPA: hypothetical protein VFR24_08715 [Candidatus Angelobacter sp.]|nr:hypothetical protein [Candidatus Angelobacter sp.]